MDALRKAMKRRHHAIFQTLPTKIKEQWTMLSSKGFQTSYLHQRINGSMSIHIAADQGWLNALNWIISEGNIGVDVPSFDWQGEELYTPLFLAVQNGLQHVVDYLIAADAD